MDWTAAIELLDRFQTLAVGIVGFGGVILTLLVNSRSARNEHRRNIKKRQAIIRSVIVAELRDFAGGIKGNLKLDAPMDGEVSTVGKPIRLLTKDISTDLGELEPQEVRAVTRAFLALEGMERRLRHMSHHEGPAQFEIGSEFWNAFQETNAKTLDALNAALLELGDEAVLPPLLIAKA